MAQPLLGCALLAASNGFPIRLEMQAIHSANGFVVPSFLNSRTDLSSWAMYALRASSLPGINYQQCVRTSYLYLKMFIVDFDARKRCRLCIFSQCFRQAVALREYSILGHLESEHPQAAEMPGPMTRILSPTRRVSRTPRHGRVRWGPHIPYPAVRIDFAPPVPLHFSRSW